MPFDFGSSTQIVIFEESKDIKEYISSIHHKSLKQQTKI